MNNKILVVGDAHLREKLQYDEYVEGGRDKEKKEILDLIVESSKDCDSVVFLGDQLNARNNASSVVKEFVNFLERFEGKTLYILSGNHELISGNRSALDFLKEVKGKDWHIITDKVTTINDLTFCPYFTKRQLESETNEEGTKKLMEKLVGGKILFAHLAISNSLTSSGISTNVFNEVVLSKEELEKRFKLVVAGHIHHFSIKDRTIIAGSLFNQEVGELQKYILKINTSTLEYEQIKLPGRPIYKLENPTEEKIEELSNHSIVKVVLTKKRPTSEIMELKEKLKNFDAYLLLESIPNQRKRMHFDEGEGFLEYSVEKLLEVYAEEKKMDINKLKAGFELIR